MKSLEDHNHQLNSMNQELFERVTAADANVILLQQHLESVERSLAREREESKLQRMRLSEIQTQSRVVDLKRENLELRSSIANMEERLSSLKVS